MSAPDATTPRGLSLPGDLVLTPVSRRPTMLEPETVRAILNRDVPAFPAAVPAVPRASVVVVSRDNLAFLRLCLESVLATTDGSCEVIVVDNGSTDETPGYLSLLAERNPGVRVVANEANRGFAAGSNQGAALAGSDVIILLNDDTIVTAGWLERLRAHLDGPRVGMVGPTTNRIGNEAQIDANYRTLAELSRFAEERAKAHPGEAFDIPTLTMFCVAIRRAVWDTVGSLDERFEVGMLEDDDYSRRVRAAGYRLLCADDAFVHHFGETSFGKLVASGDYGRILEANRARFEEKWGAPWQPYDRRHSDRYRELRDRVRKAVTAVAPPGATVLVVSRGDDELVAIGGLRAWHFPCEDDGTYSGHHPGSSEDAIALLERHRSAGAGFIVFPATAVWWLDHYDGFREHLDERYERTVSDLETCVIFDIGGAQA